MLTWGILKNFKQESFGLIFAFYSCSGLGQLQNIQRKTKGKQLQGKIGSAIFTLLHTFTEFLALFRIFAGTYLYSLDVSRDSSERISENFNLFLVLAFAHNGRFEGKIGT